MRARELTCVDDLLRGLLAYVLCARSFRHLGAWAVLIGLANLSHVAWQKHLRKASTFLLWLLCEVLAVTTAPCARTLPGVQRIVLIDATRLKEPGAAATTGACIWAMTRLSGRLLDVKVIDGHTAEGFTLFVVQAGDLVVADRGDCHRKQLAYVLQAGAQVVVRLAVHQVPLLDRQGQPFDVLAWLKKQGSGQHSCAVAFEHEGCCFAGRLIACSLPEEAAARAPRNARRRSSSNATSKRRRCSYAAGWCS